MLFLLATVGCAGPLCFLLVAAVGCAGPALFSLHCCHMSNCYLPSALPVLLPPVPGRGRPVACPRCRGVIAELLWPPACGSGPAALRVFGCPQAAPALHVPVPLSAPCCLPRLCSPERHWPLAGSSALHASAPLSTPSPPRHPTPYPPTRPHHTPRPLWPCSPERRRPRRLQAGLFHWIYATLHLIVFVFCLTVQP